MDSKKLNEDDPPQATIDAELGDGAKEKMLADNENKVAPGLGVADVKFTENQNGDAKLDIGEIRSAFVGMGKEELMKYANDPFWVRLRWFLFILFWLLWAGMLVGAIMIIYAAPKCESPEPKSWWEQGPLTEVDTTATKTELQELKTRGIQGVIIPGPLDTYAALNDSTDLIEFLKRAKEADVNVIVELKPGSSRKWFDNFAYSDYYIWAKSKSEGDYPNNWLRPNNQPAWIKSPTRNLYYYYTTENDDTPQLNFRNSSVVEEFTKVLTNLLSFGVKGFRLEGIPRLLVDESFADEVIDTSAKTASDVTHESYGFYKHSKTENLEELGPLVRTWRRIVKDKGGNGVLLLKENLEKLSPYRVNGSLVIDLPRQTEVFETVSSASELIAKLNASLEELQGTWPLWEYKTSFLPSDVLDIVTFLLPGVNLVNKNATLSQELLNLRNSPSVMFGDLNKYTIANNSAFAYIRVASGNPGYLVALNPTEDTVEVDFPEEIPMVPPEVTVQLFSSNYNEPNTALKLKKDAHSINISPKSAIVLSYVPSKEE